MSVPILLGNSSSPRWYAGGEGRFAEYLAHLKHIGATSTEIPLHHGPFDIRTARVHALERNWHALVEAYRSFDLAVQFHVSLDDRFATQRWRDDSAGLMSEYRPLINLVRSVAQDQERTVLVFHGAYDTSSTLEENDEATTGLLRWLAEEFEPLPPGACAALELGAWRESRPGASARSRDGILRLVESIDSQRVGICWDLAHDFENSIRELDWAVIPSDGFLRRVVHVHLHDVDEQGITHYPLLLGNVPFPAQLAALAHVGAWPSLTMEVRWRCARRLGVPWEMLGQSYLAVYAALADARVNSGIN